MKGNGPNLGRVPNRTTYCVVWCQRGERVVASPPRRPRPQIDTDGNGDSVCGGSGTVGARPPLPVSGPVTSLALAWAHAVESSATNIVSAVKKTATPARTGASGGGDSQGCLCESQS